MPRRPGSASSDRRPKILRNHWNASARLRVWEGVTHTSHPQTRSSLRRLLLALGIVGPLALAACSDSNDDGDAGAASTVETTTADEQGPTAVVKAGDTLSGIASSYGVSLDELVEANDWSDGANHAIFPGDEIRLPADASAVAATTPPTTRPTTAAPRPSTTTAARPTTPADEPDTVEYRPLDGYAGPQFDRSDPVETPLPDGVYWAWDATVTGNRQRIDFTLSQIFFGDACREVLGTSEEACASDNGTDYTPQATVSLEVGTGTASVTLLDGGIATYYAVPTAELARLIAGDSPSPGAPDGQPWSSGAYAVTVRGGVVVAADQRFVS